MAPLAFTCSLDAEPLYRYRPGGYHPVQLGDLLKDRRHKIVHKIGWGGYSTTWVACDQLIHQNVAVKISVSEKKNSQEAQVLRAISAFADHPGRSNLVQLLDYFTVDGPNGTHDCLILELLGPSVQHVFESYKDRLPAAIAKSAAHQVLQALDLLEQHQVAHADIHAGNIAFTLPDLDVLDKPQFLGMFGQPEKAEVQSSDGTATTANVPPYLVESFSFSGRTICESLHPLSAAKLIDFGESFLHDQSHATIHTPLPVRAPEVIFGDRIDYRADIWSMGCLLFELVTGQPPFDVFMLEPPTLVSQMMEFFTDELPARWQEKWRSIAKPVPDENAPFTLQEWIQEVYFDENKRTGFAKEDIAKVSELVGRMLRFEPSTRAFAEEILQDPWFKV